MDQAAVKRTRVLIVDDDIVDVGFLELAMESEPDLESVGIVAVADRLLKEIELNRPDVILLDLRMPGKDPLVALEEISHRHPAVKVIVFSGMNEPAVIERAFNAGAVGFITKGRGPSDILDSIRRAARGERIGLS